MRSQVRIDGRHGHVFHSAGVDVKVLQAPIPQATQSVPSCLLKSGKWPSDDATATFSTSSRRSWTNRWSTYWLPDSNAQSK